MLFLAGQDAAYQRCCCCFFRHAGGGAILPAALVEDRDAVENGGHGDFPAQEGKTVAQSRCCDDIGGRPDGAPLPPSGVLLRSRLERLCFCRHQERGTPACRSCRNEGKPRKDGRRPSAIAVPCVCGVRYLSDSVSRRIRMCVQSKMRCDGSQGVECLVRYYLSILALSQSIKAPSTLGSSDGAGTPQPWCDPPLSLSLLPKPRPLTTPPR